MIRVNEKKRPSLVITNSNGAIFKNNAIATTLTAHVYQGGAELNSTVTVSPQGGMKFCLTCGMVIEV